MAHRRKDYERNTAVFVGYAAVAYHLGVLRRVAFIDRRVFGILSH